MITVTTTTQMHFKNEEDFNKFIEWDKPAKILGFDKEILESKEKGAPVSFKTERPKYGAVTVSIVAYNEVK